MRDIRGRIAQRQGIDLSNQQIQDLAARRLESVLDPRAIKPSLLDGLKRSAAAPTGTTDKIPNEPAYSFEDTTIYDSHRGSLRFARRLLNPLLKLFFNPNPLIQALHLQAKLNVEAVERNAERDRRQTEWNALHYEIVQRLVTEVSRVSLELQALSMRVEALGARVDFNDRRVANLEGSAHRARPQGRPAETIVAAPVHAPEAENIRNEGVPPTGEAPAPDPARRRRRRRRGRRSGTAPGEYPSQVSQGTMMPGAGAEMSSTDALPNGDEEGDDAPPEPSAEPGPQQTESPMPRPYNEPHED